MPEPTTATRRIVQAPGRENGAPPAVPRGRKAAVGRPGAKEGGRREEERRSGIPVGEADGLHSRKSLVPPPPTSGAAGELML